MTSPTTGAVHDRDLRSGSALQEVVIGVALAPLSQLVRPDRITELARVLDLQGEPRTQLPYVFPSELSARANQPMVSVQLDLGPMGPGPGVRWWLPSADESRMVQVQNDYVAINWRRTVGGAPYVRFPEMLRSLRQLAAVLGDGAPPPTGAELTYINVLPQGTASNVSRVFGRSDWEGVSVAASRQLLTPEGGFSGRIHEARQPTGLSGDTNLVLTARSGHGSVRSWDGAAAFLERGHGELVRAFDELLTTSEGPA